jgi:aminoglycoside phosphotransferase (APT) family kinase protein
MRRANCCLAGPPGNPSGSTTERTFAGLGTLGPFYPARVIPERVRAWAQERLDRDIVSVAPIGGGLTDTIFALNFDDGDPAILRYSPAIRWGQLGRQHIICEAAGCRLTSGSGLPVPHLIATDPDGLDHHGFVNLTTWLPGRVRLDALNLAAIDELARVAAVIHAIDVDPESRPRPYEFWTPVDLDVPSWTDRPDLWRRAIKIFHEGPPDTVLGLIHRDFHPGNILWRGDLITGVIDWAETSWGPADLDVAHSCSNFAMLQDLASAGAFREAYLRHGGRLDPDAGSARFWRISDILGFLPDPAPIITKLTSTRPELTPDVVRARLEELLLIIVGER